MKKLFSVVILVAITSFATHVSVADKVPKPDIVYAVDNASFDVVAIAPVVDLKAGDFVQAETPVDFVNTDLVSGVADRPDKQIRSWRMGYWRSEQDKYLYNRHRLSLKTHNFTGVSRLNPQSILNC
jgi:hypothetical protein